jgi:UDP-glucose:(heptosyl)LPS alpha-1,3-glucosyltransferase
MESGRAHPAYFERACQEPAMADYVLVGSELAKASFVEHGCAPERVFVARYGCDVARFHPGAPRSTDGPFRVLYLGSRSAAKGFPYLLMLLERLSDLEIEVWLGGLDQVSGERAFGKVSVRVLGWQARDQVAALMRQADLLVHPTVLDSFSLTVLEAMASGLPVLTTAAAGASDLIEHGGNGFLTPVGDVDAMESVVRTVYSDRAYGRRVGAAACVTALAHTWQRYEEDVAAVFRQIARRGAQAGRP